MLDFWVIFEFKDIYFQLQLVECEARNITQGTAAFPVRLTSFLSRELNIISRDERQLNCIRDGQTNRACIQVVYWLSYLNEPERNETNINSKEKAYEEMVYKSPTAF